MKLAEGAIDVLPYGEFTAKAMLSEASAATAVASCEHSLFSALQESANADLLVVVRGRAGKQPRFQQYNDSVFGSELAIEAESATTSENGYAERFSDRFHRNPRTAIEKLHWDVMSGLLSRRAGIDILFAHYLSCPMRWQDFLARTMLSLASPEEILELAELEYERFGFEKRLETAATLLEKAGARSWNALSRLARSGKPECELFVRTIAFLKDVPLRNRIDVLKRLAENPDDDTREEVLEVLEYFDPREVREVLEVLAQDAEPGIREAAAEKLA